MAILAMTAIDMGVIAIGGRIMTGTIRISIEETE